MHRIVKSNVVHTRRLGVGVISWFMEVDIWGLNAAGLGRKLGVRIGTAQRCRGLEVIHGAVIRVLVRHGNAPVVLMSLRANGGRLAADAVCGRYIWVRRNRIIDIGH